MPHTNNYAPRPVNPVPSGREKAVCLLVSNMPLVQTFSSRVTSLLDNLCVSSLPAGWLATPVQLKVLINLHACFPTMRFCALTWSQPNKYLLQGLRSSCPTALWEARTVWEERFMSFEAGILHRGPTNILGQIILCCGGLSYVLQDAYTLDARSTSPL